MSLVTKIFTLGGSNFAVTQQNSAGCCWDSQLLFANKCLSSGTKCWDFPGTDVPKDTCHQLRTSILYGVSSAAAESAFSITAVTEACRWGEKWTPFRWVDTTLNIWLVFCCLVVLVLFLFPYSKNKRRWQKSLTEEHVCRRHIWK